MLVEVVGGIVGIRVALLIKVVALLVEVVALLAECWHYAQRVV